MAKYASEKNAIGNCDRCDFKYPLRRLRKELDNSTRKHLRVCPECYDEDHPQTSLAKLRINENPGLRDPRPDRGQEFSMFGDAVRYEFTDSAEGWVVDGSGLTLVHDPVNGYLNHSWSSYTGTGYTTSYNAVMNIDASLYTRVVFRYRVNSLVPNVSSAFRGWFFWSRDIDPIYPSYPFDAARFLQWKRPPYSMGDPWETVTIDMYGVTNWDNQVVDMRLDFFGGTSSTGSLDLDWIRIEKRVP